MRSRRRVAAREAREEACVEVRVDRLASGGRPGQRGHPRQRRPAGLPRPDLRLHLGRRRGPGGRRRVGRRALVAPRRAARDEAPDMRARIDAALSSETAARFTPSPPLPGPAPASPKPRPRVGSRGEVTSVQPGRWLRCERQRASKPRPHRCSPAHEVSRLVAALLAPRPPAAGRGASASEPRDQGAPHRRSAHPDRRHAVGSGHGERRAGVRAGAGPGVAQRQQLEPALRARGAPGVLRGVVPRLVERLPAHAAHRVLHLAGRRHAHAAVPGPVAAGGCRRSRPAAGCCTTASLATHRLRPRRLCSARASSSSSPAASAAGCPPR